MKKTTLGLCLALAAGSCLMTGCASTGSDKVVVINDGGSGKIVDKVLDTEDFRVKGEEMVNSLLESGVLDKASQHPAVIAIGRIINNTSLTIDPDLLMKKIQVSLNKGGKAVTDTTRGALNNDDFTFSLVDLKDFFIGVFSDKAYEIYFKIQGL